MARLTVTTFVTLDGVMQAPGGPDEDRDSGFEHGGWVVPHFDEATGAYMDEVFRRAGSFLLGRRTYDIFVRHWPHVTDQDDPIASRLNTLPKYVASRSLESTDWQSSTVIRNVPADIARLKEQANDELQVHGSGELIQSLAAHDLVDGWNVLTFPVVLGTGKRLFGGGAAPTGLRLTDHRATPSGVAIAAYERAGKPTYGTIGLDTEQQAGRPVSA
jgi:dihydrofolate reductase